MPSAPTAEKMRAVVVDTDIGNFSDDFYAIAYLLSNPRIEIKFILLSGGDTALKSQILGKFLAHCGRGDIPIGIGPQTIESPYLVANDVGHLMPSDDYVTGAKSNPIMREWGASFDLTQRAGKVYSESDSIHRLRDVLDECAESVLKHDYESCQLLTLGTSENIVHLLEYDNTVLERGNVNLFVMGGTISGEEEYNFMLSPGHTRRMLRSAPTVVVVPTDVCMESALQLGELGKRGAYATFLQGNSRISLAMAQVELALANFGTHTEVAHGRTDLIFDAVCAFVACGAAPELFVFEDVEFSVTNKGRLVRCGTDDAISMQVVMGWANKQAPLKFQMHLAESIANGP